MNNAGERGIIAWTKSLSRWERTKKLLHKSGRYEHRQHIHFMAGKSEYVGKATGGLAELVVGGYGSYLSAISIFSMKQQARGSTGSEDLGDGVCLQRGACKCKNPLQDNGTVESLLEICTPHKNNLQSQTFDHVFLLFPQPSPSSGTESYISP